MLRGKNIILRPLKISDLEKTLQWRNDLELIKLTQGIRYPKTYDMEESWFKMILTDKTNKNIYFGIDEISTGDFIGIIQLNNIDYISGTAIWGLILGDSEKRGKGYGLEAPQLLFEYAFYMLNLRKIFGYAISCNKATLRMHEKIGGFVEEGRLKKHIFFSDEYFDVIILSLFKENFRRIN